MDSQDNPRNGGRVFAIVIPVLVIALVVPLFFFRASLRDWWKNRRPSSGTDSVVQETGIEFPDDFPDELRTSSGTDLPEAAAPSTSAGATETVQPPADADAAEALTLAEAEAQVDGLCGGLSTHPWWLRLLERKRPLLSFVRLLDDVAQGQRPLETLGEFRSAESFTAAPSADGTLHVSKAAADRYGYGVSLVLAIDVSAAAKLFLKLEPALNEAYHELGYQEGDIRTLLDKALRQLLEMPLFDGEPALVETGIPGQYDWADASLRELTPVQKLFLRLGQENLSAMRSYADAFGKLVGLWAAE